MIIYKWIVFNLIFLLLGIPAIQSQSAQAENEFVFAIVEFTQSGVNGKIQANIISAKSVQKKLKRPTRSDKIVDQNLAGFNFEVLDQNQNVLDRIQIRDPLTVDYEYVDENGKLAHKQVKKDKRVMMIRRSIGNNAVYLSLRPRASVRSDNYELVKIDRS